MTIPGVAVLEEQAVLQDELASALDLDAERVRVAVDRPDDVFGSPFRVTDAAVACVAAFVASVADLEAARTGAVVAAAVDGLHAAMTFHSERLITAQRLPEDLWAPLSGNYRTADGWVRIHANLDRHAEAARRVLGISPGDERPDEAAAALQGWVAEDFVAALRAAGGVGSEMRTLAQWHDHPHHEHLCRQPVIGRTVVDHRPGDVGREDVGAHGSHLDGVRVLDLTRVIAGPVAGRLLTSFGAEVTKVDAPLDDSPTLELDTGWGKSRVRIDLRRAADRATFADLVRSSDVLLDGFRPGALADVGFSDAELRALRPDLVVAHLSAFGPAGPLGGLRGFDSVVQVATGIAHAVGFDPEHGPGALPAQALDHGAGHLLAAGVVRAIRGRRTSGQVETVEVSLARVGEWLVSLGQRDAVASATRLDDRAAPYLRNLDTPAYGTVTHVRPVGRVGERAARWPEVAIRPR